MKRNDSKNDNGQAACLQISAKWSRRQAAVPVAPYLLSLGQVSTPATPTCLLEVIRYFSFRKLSFHFKFPSIN